MPEAAALRNRVQFLGAPVDAVTLPDILDWIAAAARARQPRWIAVVNANKYYLMARDPALHALVCGADLVLPEWAVVWGARQLGLPALTHSGGLLVTRAFLPFAEQTGLRPFFLGARPEVVRRLLERLRQQYPRLPVAGGHHGYLNSPEIEAGALAAIEAARPDVLFVALGSPRQEQWIDRHRQALRVPVSIGVGGTFDVLAGLKPDAPAWARGRGLEWLTRLAQDPRAYGRRYLVTNTWFVWRVFRARLGGRQQHAAH
jgi:N-acetylglucosaminyldiphosphoundecaprenol N-acetyl-beta-D-mannosaminyltransferase